MLSKHHKYSCVNFKTNYEFHSNNQHLVEKKSAINDAQMYIRPRYEAECRLIRRYNRLISLNLLPKEIDYPQFLN